RRDGYLDRRRTSEWCGRRRGTVRAEAIRAERGGRYLRIGGWWRDRTLHGGSCGASGGNRRRRRGGGSNWRGGDALDRLRRWDRLPGAHQHGIDDGEFEGQMAVRRVLEAELDLAEEFGQ